MFLYTVDPETSRNTSVTDRCGNKTDYVYDSKGRTTRVIASDKNNQLLSNVSYSYDALDNMTEIVRGDGMKYVLEYDAYRNLDSIGIDGKSEKLIKYTYRDNNGRLKKITYANGDYMRLNYDRYGNMVSEKWYDSKNEPTYEYVYAYDNEGNIVKTIDKVNEKEYNYTYDDGILVRATEYDITLESDVVTEKTIVVSIVYSYDNEGELVRKKAVYADRMESGNLPSRYELEDPDLDASEFYIIPDTEDDVTPYISVVTSTDSDELGRKCSDSVGKTIGDIVRSFYYVGGKTPTELGGYDEDMLSQNGVDLTQSKYIPTTQLVKEITVTDKNGNPIRNLFYEYDNEERITKVVDSVDGTTEYTYDSLGQLLTEKRNGIVINSMTYDGYGNIMSKNGKSYTYDTEWKDRLMAIGSEYSEYDAQGNPTNYFGSELEWEKGRQLKAYGIYSYTYNANGIRTSKTVDGVKHTYILDGTRILKETWGTNTIIPLYDNEDNVCGICYNGTSYYFVKNLQGDVISLVVKTKMDEESRYVVVANYTYDAWGKCTVKEANGVVKTASDFVGNINPYRYRGYYYDVETGLYYLQSRYYDAEVGRFINGDEVQFSMTNESVQSHNIFSYCYNSPVINCDTTGYIAHNVVGAIVGLISGLVGGSGNGKLFKKASNQYVKKWLTRNKSLIVKGTKYYVKSFAKLIKQKVIKPIFKAFMAGLITNIALRKKFERLLA